MSLKLIMPASSDFTPRLDEKGVVQHRDGRWSMNAGSLMTTEIEGLNMKGGKPQPIALVVDMESATFSKDRIVALADHDPSNVIGYWDGLRATKEGMEGDLHLVKPEGETEKAIFSDAVKMAALSKHGVPIQVSVGANPGPKGKYEKVDADTVMCNGRMYANDTGMPMYIMRGADIYEGSLLTFGADSETGRVAASLLQPVRKENHMSDKLKVLLGKYAEKHHGLVARCVAEGEDESAISTKIHAEELKASESENTSLKAKLTAMETENTKLKADAVKTGELKVEQTEEEKNAAKGLKATGSMKAIKFGSTDGAPTGGDEGDKAKVKTMSQAIQFARASNKDLKGMAVRREARRLFPQALDG